jgi:multicomponent Na+:H+ antiporter subunit E
VIGLSIVLFAFWVVLSGKIDAFHLGLGAASAIAVAYTGRRLASVEPAVKDLHAKTWRRWPGYALWLLKEIVVSAWGVAKIVLTPGLPIAPRLVKFRCDLDHTVAHLTLANSITLTPGTVTLDCDAKEDYVVHAITKEAGDSLVPQEGEGEMQRRVRELFAEQNGSAGTPSSGAAPGKSDREGEEAS